MTEQPDDPRPAVGVADTSAVDLDLAQRRGLSPSERVRPSWTDATVRRASWLIGGPVGRHALVGRAPILTPLRVGLLMALLFLIFGWLAKSPCIQQTISDGTPVLDSSANRQWISGCYNDVVPAYQIYGLKQPGFPYAARTGADGVTLETPPYPVLVVAFMWLTARLTNGYLGLTGGTLPQPLDVAAFFTIGAILLGFLYLWAVASTVRISRRRPWDAAIMCLSPLLVVTPSPTGTCCRSHCSPRHCWPGRAADPYWPACCWGWPCRPSCTRSCC